MVNAFLNNALSFIRSKQWNEWDEIRLKKDFLFLLNFIPEKGRMKYYPLPPPRISPKISEKTVTALQLRTTFVTHFNLLCVKIFITP